MYDWTVPAECRNVLLNNPRQGVESILHHIKQVSNITPAITNIP
jgi:hypothetical protein